jgi:hypothetical protein
VAKECNTSNSIARACGWRCFLLPRSVIMISLGEIEIAEVEGMATCREYSINAEYLSFISQLLFIIIVIIYLFLFFFL